MSDYRAAVLADNPISFWELNETSGTTAADQEGRITGAIEGGVTLGAPGPFSDATSMVFDGQPCTGVNLDSGGSLLKPAAVTVEAWVRTTRSFGVVFRLRHNGYIITAGTGGSTDMGVDPHPAFASSLPVADGTWHYLVGTADATSAKIYVDGTLTGSETYSGGINYGTDAQAAIGRDGDACDGVTASFQGWMADVAVYGQALTAQQIAAHAVAAGVMPQGGPLGLAETSGCNDTEINADAAQSSCVDPVDTATGNFHEDFTDLSIPGRGMPLDYSRSYNSSPGQTLTAGPLGYGWTDSYHMGLSVSGTTATITQETGAQVSFTQSGSSWLPAAPRIEATLVQNGDGSWTFTRRGLEIFTFNASGQLVGEQDPSGVAATPPYSTTLAYNGSGQLTTVTDPASRTLTFTYWPTGTGSGKDGLIHTVADSTGRTVTFDYTDSHSNLTDVVDAGNGHRQFTYDTNHRLLTKRAPKYFGDTTTTPTPVVTNTYDSSGRVTAQSDELGRNTTIDYTTVPGSTIVTDPKGNQTFESYVNGLRTTMTKGYGTAQAATWQYSYDTATIGQTQVTDPNGHSTSATYDANGNQTSTLDALNRSTSATYNAFNETLTQTDGKNITTTYTYDGSGNLLTKSTPWVEGPPNTNQVTTYHHNDAAHPSDITSMTDADNKTWTYAYDSAGDVSSQTDPLTNVTGYCYDTAGRRTKLISPLGTGGGVTCSTASPAAYTTYFTYNDYGDQLTATDPLGHGVVKTYDANRNLKTYKDADNNQTSYTFDPANELTQTIRPDTTTLKSDYWADGSLKSQTDGANHSTAYAYDPLAHLTTLTDPNSRVTTYAYDAVGNLLSKQDPGGNCAAVPATACTKYAYDAANQATGITYSDGTTPNVSNIGYDNDGQRIAMTDGTGTSAWVWDSLHRLVSSTDGAGKTLGYGYDLNNHETSLVYPGTTGTVTRGYDDAGRLHTVTDWNTNTTTFNYNADSFLTSENYPNGVVATFTPDGADRLMAIADTKGATTLASFTYGRDNNNQLNSVASTGVPSDNHSYSYTQLNQLKTQDTSNYTYDNADNPTGLADGTTQAFDPANQLTSATSTITLVGTANGGNASTPDTVTVNLPAGTTANDQIIVGTTVQKSQTVTTPTGYTVVGTFTSGNPNTDTKTIVYRKTAQAGDTNVAVTFGASIAKSITVAVYRGVNPNTPIDVSSSVGNDKVTSIAVPSVTTTAANERLVNVAGEANTTGSWTVPSGMTSRTTAAFGNSNTLLADQTITNAGATGTRTDTFSTKANLVGVLLALNPASTSYGYDTRGNRTTITPSGGTATTLGYDQANRLTSYGTATYKYNGDGLREAKTISGTTTQQTWDAAEALPLLLGDGTTSYIYGVGGVPIEQVSGSTVLYYQQDQLGSTRTLTDASGNSAATFSYDPYGRLTGSTGTTATPFGFAGQYTDVESGLQYLRARYYDPTTSQFLTIDPISMTTREPYEFASDTPLDRSDPGGLCAIEAKARRKIHGFTCAPPVNRNLLAAYRSNVISCMSGPLLGTLRSGSSAAQARAEALRSGYDIPDDLIAEPADNGQGWVFRVPGTTGNASIIRVGEQDAKNPTGYVRYYNEQGQPMTEFGGTQTGPPEDTHLPLLPDEEEPPIEIDPGDFIL